MSVNVPSDVKHSTQPLTSTFSARSYALRMISSLFTGKSLLFDGTICVRRDNGRNVAESDSRGNAPAVKRGSSAGNSRPSRDIVGPPRWLGERPDSAPTGQF